MKRNKNEVKNKLNDLFGDVLDVDIPEEKKEDKKEVPVTSINTNNTKSTIQRTYYILKELEEDMKKYIYVERIPYISDFINKAISEKLYSEEGKKILKEYEKLKGGNKNE